LVALPGDRPTLEDWRDHLTTLFPDVRLKRFLEMRGADAGTLPALWALPALWVGLLYDKDTLEAAYALIKDWTGSERQALRDSVPRLGLSTTFRKSNVLDIARQVVFLAETGLKRRKRLDPNGNDESLALLTLIELLEQGRSPADLLLADFNNDWRGNIDEVFKARAF
jgi:glutamate--cysteine ligase